MPFFFVGLVVAPWIASTTGRLMKSALGYDHPSAPEANPAEPIPDESHTVTATQVPQPAKTDFEDRSFIDLTMQDQNTGTGLNCPLDETKEKKQEQGKTSPCSASNPAEPIPYESPLKVPQPAKTDFEDRSFIDLKVQDQNTGTSLNCPLDETKEKKEEQDKTSSVADWLKLPPLALYMCVNLNPFLSCPVDEEDDLELQQLAERWFHKNTQVAAVFCVTHEELLECLKRFKERKQQVPFTAKVAHFFRPARAKIVDFWSWISEKSASLFTKDLAKLSSWIFDHHIPFCFICLVAVSFLLYFFIYRKRARITVVFSSTEDNSPQVLPSLNLQAKYFPGNEEELQITFPEPQRKLRLLYPGSVEALELVFKQPEEQMKLFVPTRQGLKLFFPHSEEEWQVPFQGPVKELLLLYPESDQGFLLIFPSLGGRICATISKTTALIRAAFSTIRARIAGLFPTTRADIEDIISRAYDQEPEPAMLTVLSLWFYIVCRIFVRYTTVTFYRIQGRIKRAVSGTLSRTASCLLSAYERTRSLFDTVSRGIAALFPRF